MALDLVSENMIHKKGDYTRCTSEYINYWLYKMRAYHSITQKNFRNLFMECGRSYAHYSQLIPQEDFSDDIMGPALTTRKGLCHQLAYEIIAGWHIGQPEVIDKHWRIVWGYVDAIENGTYDRTYTHSFLVCKNQFGAEIILDPLHMALVFNKKQSHFVNHYGIELPVSWLKPASEIHEHAGWAYVPHSKYIKENILPSTRKTNQFIDFILENRL